MIFIFARGTAHTFKDLDYDYHSLGTLVSSMISTTSLSDNILSDLSDKVK